MFSYEVSDNSNLSYLIPSFLIGGIAFTLSGILTLWAANPVNLNDQKTEEEKADDDLKTSISFDSLVLTDNENVLTNHTYGGPSPISLDNDEGFNYYAKLSNLHKSDWREDALTIDDKDKDTPDKWVKRHHSLIRLTGRHPFNCEPPLSDLVNKGFLTPAPLHYVRSHSATPNIDWNKHRVYVSGIVKTELSLSMSDIIKLPTVTLPVTLVCCGNRRKEQNMIKQTIGFNWGAAGISNGLWTGVRMSDILKLAGVTENDTSLFVRFASENEKGGDKLPGGIYGTSVPLVRALDPSYDIILAFLYNGELLQPDHGFPIRVIIPGYIGGRMIKWLTDITIQKEESQDYGHIYDNKVLPSHVDAETAKSEDWWHRPEYICNELNINSATSSPAHDQIVPVTPGKTLLMKGYAYSGGGRKITRAELSLDSGVNWIVCRLNRTELPTVYGKYWCWVLWEYDMPVTDLANSHEVVLRAWDESTNTQPDRPTWNVMGMLNNPWFRIKIHRIQSSGGGVALQFEHPTQAGAQEGGWMVRLKGDPSLITPGSVHGIATTTSTTTNHIPSSIMSINSLNNDSPAIPASDVFDATKPNYSFDEIKLHNKEESCWIVVKNKVYDCTPFLKDHPGGPDSIILNGGMDSTEDFDAIHSKKAWKMLEEYYIGEVVRPIDIKSESPVTVATSLSSNEITNDAMVNTKLPVFALDPKKKIAFRLIQREKLSHDSQRLRFALQSPSHILGLPIGQHMYFYASINGKTVMRAYTPTSSNLDVGFFELVIKVYSPCTAFPEGGLLSQYLGSLPLNYTVDVKGPVGHVTYEGRGGILLRNVAHVVKSFAMICGGTGITPIYQIITAVLRDDEDLTELFVLYSNRTEEDILLREELEQLAVRYPSRLHIKHVLSKGGQEGIKTVCDYATGRICKDMITSYLPSGEDRSSFALLCGPPGLLDDVCNPGLKAHGYEDYQCVYF